jgi:hypothetical protein
MTLRNKSSLAGRYYAMMKHVRTAAGESKLWTSIAQAAGLPWERLAQPAAKKLGWATNFAQAVAQNFRTKAEG